MLEPMEITTDAQKNSPFYCPGKGQDEGIYNLLIHLRLEEIPDHVRCIETRARRIRLASAGLTTRPGMTVVADQIANDILSKWAGIQPCADQ